MGGLLRAPKVQAAPPPAAAPAPVVVAAADPAAEAEAARRRRGLAGTIATSDRGLVDDGRIVPSRKMLLGE